MERPLLLKHKSQKVSQLKNKLMVAGLRLAVFLNLVVTSQPGWGQSSGSKFTIQAK